MKRPRELPMNSEPRLEMPLLARVAGAFLLAATLFALAAIVAFGVYGRGASAAWACGGAGVVCLALWFVGRAQAQKYAESVPLDAAAKARALLGLNSVASLLLVGVLLVGVNYLAGRHRTTFDLTRNRLNSLADQTGKALGELPRPVRLTYYFRTQLDPNAQTLLDSYRRASDKIRVSYVNADAEPLSVPRLFTGQPLIVAQLEKDASTPQTEQVRAKPELIQPVRSIDEEGITSALLKLVHPKSDKIYFLSGHGEVEPRELASAMTALLAQNYSLDVLSLLRKDAKIPTDAVALVVAAPQVDLSATEANLLTAYVSGRGRLVLLLSPRRGDAALPRWDALLKTVGLRAGRGFVSDPQAQNPQLPVGDLTDKSRHPILTGTSGAVVFPGAVPLTTLEPPPPADKVVPLFFSSTLAQAPDKTPGPFVLAAAIERGGSRILVVSSTLLLTEQFFSQLGDRSFWLAGVNWTVGNEALVSIPPKTPTANTLDMPAPAARFAAFLSLLIMPVLALLMGAVVWWMRR